MRGDRLESTSSATLAKNPRNSAGKRPLGTVGVKQQSSDVRDIASAKVLSSRWVVLVGAGALVAAALALRLSLLVRSGWLLEGDDALSTLMALNILSGDRPIMLKNQ